MPVTHLFGLRWDLDGNAPGLQGTARRLRGTLARSGGAADMALEDFSGLEAEQVQVGGSCIYKNISRMGWGRMRLKDSVLIPLAFSTAR